MVARLASELLRDPGDLTDRSRCTHCGHPILWAQKQPEDGGGWHAPLVFKEFVLTVVEGFVYRVPSYTKHVCDPTEIERFAEEKQALERAAAERRVELAEQKRQRAAVWDEEERRRVALELASLKYRCPDCLVEPDQMCLHRGKLKRGVHEAVKHPHAARQQLALDEHPELALPIDSSDRA